MSKQLRQGSNIPNFSPMFLNYYNILQRKVITFSLCYRWKLQGVTLLSGLHMQQNEVGREVSLLCDWCLNA